MRRSPRLAAATLASLLGGGAVSVAAQPHKLSLADAVRAAVASDADLYIAREETLVTSDEVALARAAFGTRLFGEIYGRRDDLPPSARSFSALDTIVAGSIGVTGRLETGLTYSLSAGLLRHERVDPFSTIYDGATTTTVRAEITQPLWRGGFAAARRPMVVASLQRDRSEHELRARLERTIGTVQVAYWNLVRVRSERDARVSALSLAREQVEESRRLAKIGTGADLDVIEAEAGVGRRNQELLRTEQEVAEVEGRLFEVIGVRPGEPGWSVGTLEPTDGAQIKPVAVDLDAQLALAREKRGEVLAARGQIAAEATQLQVTEDLRRPALDVVVAGGTMGFAGSLAPGYLTAGVNGSGLSPPYMTDPAYDGGVGTSLSNTLGRDLQFYLGLRFEMQLGDSEADQRNAIQKRAVARARLSEREALAQIESEVRTTVARIAIDIQLVEAADHAVVLSEKLLEGTRKRFRAGARTTFDVLRVSEELTRARVEAARARADYRVGLTRLAAATGTLLEALGVTVKSLGPSPR